GKCRCTRLTILIEFSYLLFLFNPRFPKRGFTILIYSLAPLFLGQHPWLYMGGLPQSRWNLWNLKGTCPAPPICAMVRFHSALPLPRARRFADSLIDGSKLPHKLFS